MDAVWVPTNKHVYLSIYREHYKDLTVFSSCTDIDCEFNSIPIMTTEWGFKDGGLPLIKSIATKEDKTQKEWDYKYFIAKYLEPKGGDD